MIGGRNENVVDVEQEAATGAARQFADEIGLGHRGMLENDIGRGIFEKDGAADPLLHLIDVVGDALERRRRIGKRQQVIEVCRIMGRPRQMLGYERRLVALD